jgi:hypothetical protein
MTHVANPSINGVLRQMSRVKIGDDLPQNAKSICRTHLALWWYFAASRRRIVALQ